MKLEEWGKLLISWANFLDPNENITKIEELCTSGLFPRLLKVLQCAEEVGNAEEYYNYLQEQYISLDFGGQKNRDLAVLQATAFLIYCSLHHPNNDLQQKMIELPHLIQCQLTDFLQEFVDVPRPKITRESIFSKISEMRSVDLLESSVVHTPSGFGTPVTYTSSPSTGEIMCAKTNSSSKKTSRLKKLRKDIDTLTLLKVELSEELDSAKECIAKLESDLKKKDTEISKLRLEINKSETDKHVCETQKSVDSFKLEKFKSTIETLEQQKCELENNMVLLTNEKDTIYEELKKAKNVIQKAEIQQKLSDDLRSDLEADIAHLKRAIEQLTITNNEQSEYIAELTMAKDDSKSFSDSQTENVILPESLGQHFFDLQVRELKEQLEHKETEIAELKKSMNGLNDKIQERVETIDKQDIQLKCKESELKEKCLSIKSLEEAVSKLNCELQTNREQHQTFIKESEQEIEKIKEELNASNEVLVAINEEKEKLKKDLDSKLTIIELYEKEEKNLRDNIKLNNEELSSLKLVVEKLQNELDNTMKSNIEEMAVKSDQIRNLEDSLVALVDKNTELNNLLESLTAEIEEKNVSIKNNETDLRNLECQNLFLTNTLQEKDSIINSMQISINTLVEDSASLKLKESSLITELKASNCHISQLESQKSDLDELLNTYISEKNTLLKAVEDKETIIQQQMTKLKDMKTDFEASKRKLECELEQKEKEYKEVEEDRCRLNIDLDDLKHKFLSLEIKMKEKDKEVSENCSIIDKLETDIESYVQKEVCLSNKLNEYEKNLLKTEQELSSSKTMISELQKEVSQLLLEAEEHNKVEFNLKNQLLTNADNVNNLKAKLIEAEIKHKELQEVMESSNLIIAELKLSISKLNEDLLLNNEINDLLTKDLTERNETIKNFENDMKTLQSKLLSSNEENHNLVNDVLSKSAALDELQEKIDSYKAEINSLVMKKEETSQELEEYKERYNVELQKSKKLQDQLLDYVLKVNTFADDLLSKENIISKLEKEIIELKKSKNEMEEIKDIAQNEVTQLLAEIRDLETNKISLSGQLNEAQKCVESLNTYKLSCDNEIASLKNSNNILKDQLEIELIKCHNLGSEKKVLSQEITKLKHINKELEKKIEDSTTQGSDYSQKLKESQSELKKLKQDLISEKSKLTKKYDNLMSDFEKVKDAKEVLDDRCTAYEEKVWDLNRKITTLKDEVSRSEKNISHQNTTVCNLNNEIDCLKKLVSTYEFEEGVLNSKLKAKEEEINKLQLNLNGLNKQLQMNEEKFEEEMALKLKKIDDLDSTIGKLNSQYIQVSKEKESLIVELENKGSLDFELKSLKNSYKSLKEEMETMEQVSILKNEEISQLKHDINLYEKEIQSLKTEIGDQNKILKDKIKELEEINSYVTVLQNEKEESKIKEKVMMEQLVIHNDMILSIEQNLILSDNNLQESETEINSLKNIVQKKDEQMENLIKENNCLKLDKDILSKNNDIAISKLNVKQNEIQEICNKLKNAESDISKLSLKITEQDQTIESLYATLHSQNVELNERSNEIDLLQKELKSTIQQLMDERANKSSQIQKLKAEKEIQEAKLKSLISEDDYKDRIEHVKSSYEKKVLTLKSVMKKQFTEKLEDLTYTLQNENTDLKEKILREQEKCARLQSELWNASDKLLIAQEQNRTLLSNFQSRNVYEVLRPNDPISPISKARSMEVLSGRNRGIDNFARDISFNESGSSRRSSIRSLPRGMGKKFSFSAGKVFPAAEEDGEVFDSRYLTDLKAGRCDVQYDSNRMSILQYRNSLCPPHLKSSYPAETQFINTVKEDDIKVGAGPLTGNSESDGRKTKIQSSYKKPGPPTPSKKGGRLSQGGEKPCPSTPHSGQNIYTASKDQPHEKFLLREVNIKKEPMGKPLKPSTPSRLKALFTHKKDENSPRRKSFFRRS